MSTTIDSTLNENRTFTASADFITKANVNADKLAELKKAAAEDHEGFWGDLAKEHISWHKPFSTLLNSSQAPHYSWFDDGELNVSYNCLDRHLKSHGEKTAIIFEGEPGDVRHISYTELHKDVSIFANALKNQGVSKGDRVIVYMPMIPEAVIAMQACARIGAIHSIVFGGFSAASLRDRIEDTGAKIVITADGGNRGGRVIELKKTADAALDKGCASVEKVIVYPRTNSAVTMKDGRDIWWNDAIANMDVTCEPEWVNSEHPLFILYTSGSTGNPKGVQHSSGGYLLNCITSMNWVFDIQDSDVFWCTADVGWITGHSYVTYGPLATGATMLMFEGAPTVPDAGRFWKICQDHKVTIFYTAPTALRALMKAGDDFPNTYDLSSLRLLGTVGEPINPEAWMWYHHIIGKEKCPIVDTWWQTETGAHVIAPIPGAMATKPGSCTLALPGMDVAIVDNDGNVIEAPNKGGFLVIKKPWPSMIRTVWGDDERYQKTYWAEFDNKYYVAGDNVRRDEDGYLWIMGRTDDVLNVSGHRLGTMEIESALVAHPRVAEAAVVGRPHDVKGEAIFAYVVLREDRPPGGIDEVLTKELRNWVGEQIGAIAKPDDIRYADNLPKTRSGKIMRRLLKVIARGDEITQDTSTLENEAILEQLQGRG